MGKFIDEVGNHYGRLTVIKRAESKSGAARWLCKCDCGNETLIFGSNLRKGHTKSCGCLQKERVSLSVGEAAFNRTALSMRRNAGKRNLKWALTKDQVRILVRQNCHYCGIAPQQKLRHERYNGAFIYNGIDRLDNTKGYTINNVVPCCGVCNLSKRAMTIEQFQEWLTRAYRHYIEKSDGAVE